MGLLTKSLLRTVALLSRSQTTAFKAKSPTIPQFFSIRYASSKYKAAVLKKVGEPLVVEELARKPLKKGEMRIRVYCCGINSIDQMTVSGQLEPTTKLPIVPGYEVCGELLEVSEEGLNKAMQPGQRVIGMHSDFQGGFAEEIVISSAVIITYKSRFNSHQCFSYKGKYKILFYCYIFSGCLACE